MNQPGTYDLTHPLTDGMPQYPGHPLASFAAVNTVPRDGNLMTAVDCWSHTGTHVDAPAHMIADGATVYDLPVTQWMGWAQVVRVQADVTGEIQAHQFADLQEGIALLVSTGHSSNWGTKSYFTGSPYLSIEAATLIRDRGVPLLGLDFCSPDKVGADGHPCHDVILGAGIPIIENLAHTVLIMESTVWFCAAPLLLGAGDGGPCRAFAIGSSGPAAVG
jgi:kynurenine formamidase